MKFARYLEDTQTPEWKRAYIDYRGLKKSIAAIRKSQEEYAAQFSDQQSPPLRLQPLRFSHNCDSVLPMNALGLSNLPRVSFDCPSVHQAQVNHDHYASIQPPEMALDKLRWDPKIEVNSRRSTLYVTPAGEIEVSPAVLNNDALRHSQVKDLSTLSRNSNLKRRRRPFSQRFSFASIRSALEPGIDPSLVEGLPLSEVSRLLTLQEQQFFVMLDAELEKVDAFYAMKESELQARTGRLSEQLKELANHRRIVHKSPSFMSYLRSRGDGTGTIVDSDMVEGQAKPSPDFEPNEARRSKHSNDPELLYAERKLKKAVTEHYREIEALVNYRILNITGFRKALKKFEKVTKVPVQGQYMSEKIDKTGIMNNQDVKQMMQEMEKLYAQAFTRNDSKDARDHLRSGGSRVTSHHFSTFRSGLCLGVALPLFISALYELYSQSSRNQQNQTPHWQSILHVYGILFLPAIYPLLVSLNIFGWARFRINYVFIFELDTRTRLDMHEYLELPTFIFATFCLAFRLSFSSIALSHVKWYLLPFAWLLFMAIVLVNPLRVWFKDSRYWFLRLFGNLFLSGIRRVEFADFWLADQFCSFSYTSGGLVYVVCIYSAKFNEQTCGTGTRILVAQWALASLPMFIRLVQCLKRYRDSMLRMHLLNASRYASGIIALLIFDLWRALGTPSGYLTTWSMANTFYSLFSCAWDLCMDWSLLSLQSPHPFLREELVYSNYIYVYYIAIILDVMLRFAWIIYIPVPDAGWDFRLRSFIVAFLEMLRRLQWNAFRLESEHLGNVDQYRIVREVPLPYTLDDDDERSSRDRFY